MRHQRKVSFASCSVSSTPAFDQRNLPVLQQKIQNPSTTSSKGAPDQASLEPIQVGVRKINPNVPPPTPLYDHRLKTNPDLLALTQMFEQKQASGQPQVGDRRISQSLVDLPERMITLQHKPRKLEPLLARDKIIIPEQSGVAGLHLAVNYMADKWIKQLSKHEASATNNLEDKSNI